MFNNVTQAYDLTDATWEILIMLGIAFLLGWLFHWGFFCTCGKSKVQGKDDLTLIEGIGPKIEGLLNDAGIQSFAVLSETNKSTLKQILRDAGPRFKMHEPTTWAKQAKMAEKGDWKGLEEYQDFLLGGKDHA